MPTKRLVVYSCTIVYTRILVGPTQIVVSPRATRTYGNRKNSEKNFFFCAKAVDSVLPICIIRTYETHSHKESKMNTVKIVKVNTCWGAYWYAVKVNGVTVANCGTMSHAQEISKKYS